MSRLGPRVPRASSAEEEIQPWLVSGAAAGLMMVMVSATVLHTVRGEVSWAATTAVLLALATFVAYMRWKVKPIAPRTAAAPLPGASPVHGR